MITPTRRSDRSRGCRSPVQAPVFSVFVEIVLPRWVKFAGVPANAMLILYATLEVESITRLANPLCFLLVDQYAGKPLEFPLRTQGIYKKRHFIYREAFPRGSKGSTKANAPANRIKPPLTYTGTAVVILTYNAIIGDCENERRPSERMSNQPSGGSRLRGTEIKSRGRLTETRGREIHVPISQIVSRRCQSMRSRFPCLWQEISPERSHTKHHT